MKCWNRYPALYYGLAVTAGVSFYWGFWPLLFLGLLGGRHVRLIGFYLIVTLSYMNAKLVITDRQEPVELTGYGYFQCKRIRPISTGDKQLLNYQGVLECFITKEKTYWNIPCYITVTDLSKREKGDRDYIVQGKITRLGTGSFKMQVKKWHRIQESFSLAEMRYQLKQRLRTYLKSHISHKTTYAFFASLGTGEIETKTLSKQFSQAGLTHTLAISGFHYTYLIIACSAFLGLFFSPKKVAWLLIFLISVYFFFIGETPSLTRAWLSSLIYLAASLTTYRSFGLNSLGCAMLISLTLDPSALSQIGFQMSYLATFAILTLYRPCDHLLQTLLLPRRALPQIRKMPYLDQHGYLFSTAIRGAFALTLPVNLMTIPLSLFHFHYFPLAALFFNLFFPIGITVSLIGLMVAVILPFGDGLVFSIIEPYSKLLLDMAFYGLGPFQASLYALHMGVWETAFWLMGAGVLALFIEDWRYRLTLKTDL